MADAGSNADNVWKAVGEALDGQGWRWRGVAVERLAEAAGRVATALTEADQNPGGADSDGELLVAARAELPEGLPGARSIVVGALAQPLTQASLRVDGTEHVVRIPPHYASYYKAPRHFSALVSEALAPFGYRSAEARMPLKTLAAGSGLALFGRNNIAYVPGLGSYLSLAACATEAAPPTDAQWGGPGLLTACLRCFACARICPTGAITGETFLIRHDLCLTMINESDEPFPAWVRPEWHTCAVGCLECQRVCPQNWHLGPIVAEPVPFDETETAAILSGDDAALAGLAASRDDFAPRREACGLDYESGPMARNLRALLARRDDGAATGAARRGQA